MFSQARVFFSKVAKKLNLWRGLDVSQFLTALSDLVNPGERGLASLQVFLARVNVSLLRERRVVVTGPLADDGDRHDGVWPDGHLIEVASPQRTALGAGEDQRARREASRRRRLRGAGER